MTLRQICTKSDPEPRFTRCRDQPRQLALDPAMTPPRVLPRQAQYKLLECCRSGRAASASPPVGVVPLAGDQPPVPSQQRPRRDWEDVPPVTARYQRRQRGQPEPVRGLVANRTVELSSQHRVLVPQHQKFGVLGSVPAQQHRWHGQQRTRGPVQQRDDHPRSIPATTGESARRLPSAAMTLRAPQVRRGVGWRVASASAALPPRWCRRDRPRR